VTRLRRLQLPTTWGELLVAGGSRAGEGTLILLPQLRLALDLGRAHRAVPPMRTACLSHGHADHVGGLAYWASQRALNSLGPGVLVVPEAIADDVAALLGTYGRLEGGTPYAVTLVPARDRDRIALRRDMQLELFATDHWVPTLGTRLVWTRRRLRPDLAGADATTLAELRRRGETITTELETPLLVYAADTGPGCFADPRTLAAEVVLLECSFVGEGDQERARRFGHLHLDDLVAGLPALSCRHLVLLHASRRHRIHDVETVIESELAPRLEGSIHHLLVDWD
jgi:ribonuclease Z